MSYRAVLAGLGLLFISGCLYHAREHADTTVAELVNHPYDTAPVTAAAGRATGRIASSR